MNDTISMVSARSGRTTASAVTARLEDMFSNKGSALETGLRKNRDPTVVNFMNFMERFRVEAGQQKSNITVDSKVYYIRSDDYASIRTMFRYIGELVSTVPVNQCPRINESQYPPKGVSEENHDDHRSGLVFDFDYKITSDGNCLSSRHRRNLTKCVLGVFGKCFHNFTVYETDDRGIEASSWKLAEGRPSNGGSSTGMSEELVIRVGFSAKSAPRDDSDTGRWKYGEHMLIPAIRLTRREKVFLMHALVNDPGYQDIMADLPLIVRDVTGRIKDDSTPEERAKVACDSSDGSYAPLDVNSSHIPVYMVGCAAKVQAEPHVLREVGTVTLDGDFAIIEYNGDSQSTTMQSLRGKAPRIFSPNYSTEPYVVGVVTDEMVSMFQRMDGITSSFAAVTVRVKSEINNLNADTQLCARAMMLFDVINILPISMSTGYSSWCKVLRCLANDNPRWKPLAEWFSMKCPDKYNEGEFNRNWERALNDCTEADKLGYMFAVARRVDPQAMQIIEDSSVSNRNKSILRQHGYTICHAVACDLAMVRFKGDYTAATDPDDPRETLLYEFETDASSAGFNKWQSMHQDSKTSMLYVRVQEYLRSLMGTCMENLKTCEKNAANDVDAQKVYRSLAGAAKASYNKIGTRGFIKTMLSDFGDRLVVKEKAFGTMLDRSMYTIGVSNGVLRLGKGTELVTTRHSIPISRSTGVPYIAYDPDDPLCVKILGQLAGVFLEDDMSSFNRFMHLISGSLTNESREQFFVFLRGTISGNGKSSLVLAIKRALGDDYSGGRSELFIHSPGGKSNGESAAPYALDLARKRLTDIEEIGARCIDAEMIKKSSGGGTTDARTMYSSVVHTVPINTICLITSNNNMKISGDNIRGIPRRAQVIDARVEFVDPSKLTDPKYQRVRDTRVINQYKDDQYAGRVLGILVKFYENKERWYKSRGSLVPAPRCDHNVAEWVLESSNVNQFCKDNLCMLKEFDLIVEEGKISECEIEFDEDNVHEHSENIRRVVTLAVQSDKTAAIKAYAVPVASFYRKYQSWCNDNQLEVMSKRQFVDIVSDDNYASKFTVVINNVTYIVGHDLKSPSRDTVVLVSSFNKVHEMDKSKLAHMTISEYQQAFNICVRENRRLPTGIIGDTMPAFEGEALPYDEPEFSSVSANYYDKQFSEENKEYEAEEAIMRTLLNSGENKPRVNHDNGEESDVGNNEDTDDEFSSDESDNEGQETTDPPKAKTVTKPIVIKTVTTKGKTAKGTNLKGKKSKRAKVIPDDTRSQVSMRSTRSHNRRRLTQMRLTSTPSMFSVDTDDASIMAESVREFISPDNLGENSDSDRSTAVPVNPAHLQAFDSVSMISTNTGVSRRNLRRNTSKSVKARKRPSRKLIGK